MSIPFEELNNQQRNAIKTAQSMIKAGERRIMMSGAAGTGKSTMMAALANSLADDFGIVFATPTHKARMVLQGKLPASVKVHTIHSLTTAPIAIDEARAEEIEVEIGLLVSEFGEHVDQWSPRQQAKLSRLKREQDDVSRLRLAPRRNFPWITEPGEWVGVAFRPRVLLIDEASMVGGSVTDALSTLLDGDDETTVVGVGDFNQLPPVGGKPFFDAQTPHMAPLTQIVRQAADSDILIMAHEILRAGSLRDVDLTPYESEDLVIPHRRARIDPRDYDAVVVGVHRTRATINNYCRRSKGFYVGDTAKPPQDGEPVLAMTSSEPAGVFNGMTGVAVGEPLDVSLWNSQRVVVTMVHFADEPKPRKVLLQLEHERPKKTWRDNFAPFFGPRELVRAAWGYAITCHKAQGSEYDNLLLINESDVFGGRFAGSEATGLKWLYTGVTRAKKRLTIASRLQIIS